MHKFALAAAAALTAVAFGSAAMAQETDFQKYDGDKDGFITWEEAFAAYPTLTEVLYNQTDANADGKLDEAEFTALQGLTAGLDTNASATSSSAM